MNLQNFLSLTFVFSLCTNGFAYQCGQVEETEYETIHTFCDVNGQIERVEKRFRKTDTPSVVDTYRDEKIILRQNYNTEYDLTQEFGFEYPGEGTFFKLRYRLGVYPRVELGRTLYKGFVQDSNPVMLAEWVYEKNESNEPVLQVVDYYDAGLIVKREIFKESKKVGFYIYEHPKESSVFKHVNGFLAYDANGNKVSEYRTDQSLDLRKYVKTKDKLDILLDSKRRRIVIFDTGFDVSNKDLAYKFFLNPKEKLNGEDSDGNGIVDDVLGWNVTDDGDFTNNINELISVKPKSKPYKPFSHGTHVASVALSGVDEFALTAFSGNMSDVEHLDKISKLITNEDIEFVNMSFSLGSFKDPMAPAKKSFDKLKRVIKNNPDTVFTVSAGNRGQNLDGAGVGNREFPASFKFKNILSVGALEASVLEEFEMPTYKPISFSAYGTTSVDIFSPGYNVKGAAVGVGYVEASGTSMAAPYALNIMLKIARAYPSLSPLQIKDVILYSAYIPNIAEPFPCTSGGMLFPRRAFEVARKVLALNISVKEAAIQTRKDKDFLLEGEQGGVEYLIKLKTLWNLRGLGKLN